MTMTRRSLLLWAALGVWGLLAPGCPDGEPATTDGSAGAQADTAVGDSASDGLSSEGTTTDAPAEDAAADTGGDPGADEGVGVDSDASAAGGRSRRG